jgi:hypothetical protein
MKHAYLLIFRGDRYVVISESMESAIEKFFRWREREDPDGFDSEEDPDSVEKIQGQVVE